MIAARIAAAPEDALTIDEQIIDPGWPEVLRTSIPVHKV
jgi:hypothetical protein